MLSLEGQRVTQKNVGKFSPLARYDLGAKWNTSVAKKLILKYTIDAYMDNFGIQAFAIKNQLSFRANYSFIFNATLRFYHQDGSRYFLPHNQHDSSSKYFTSDHDLSSFQTYSIGFGTKYFPFQNINKLLFDAIKLDYRFFLRSNGLSANMISITFNFSHTKHQNYNSSF